MKELQGKVALVTGVGRPEGIGAALCRRLASEGVDIFYTYWHSYDIQHFPNTENPEKFMDELRANDVRVEGTDIDLSRTNTPRELFRAVQERFGTPDILINNACYDRSVPFTELTSDALDAHYAVNVRAVTILCVEFMKAWKKQSGGRIINMTSGQSFGSMDVDQIPYTITKAGLEMLAKQLAPGILNLGVTINAIDPGPTDTGWMSDALKEKLRKESIVNEPQGVADVIFALLLRDADATTGRVIHIGR
jgi:3-oxoacyl-[acyl-carrier protein] reductase